MSSDLPSLLKRTRITDHEEILRAANAALKQKKNDLDAQHAKVVALLKLDRFEDAVHAFDTAEGGGLKQKARLEYAYALYKTGKAEEAAGVAREGGEERGYRHVEAQAAYRTEDFPRAKELYTQLASPDDNDNDDDDDAEADLRINTGAVDAQLEWTYRGDLVTKKKPEREDLEAFETAYNAACASIAQGELAQGEVLLKRAKGLCEGMEELSAEEKKGEVGPILAMWGFVLLRLGRGEEARGVMGEIEGGVGGLGLVGRVNRMVAEGGEGNPFLASRVLGRNRDDTVRSGEAKQDQPFEFQAKVLRQNQYALELQSAKFEGLVRSTKVVLAGQTSSTLDPEYNVLSVVNAAAHAKARSGKEALKYILPELEKRPYDVGLVLTIAQLYVLTGNSSTAITMLEKFLSRLEQAGSVKEMDVRFAPGLVGAMVSLYQSAGRRGHARAELAEAAQYWQRKGKESSGKLPGGVVNLFKAAGSSLLESEEKEHQELAAGIFTDLHQRDEKDRYAAAGLLAASPQTATNTQTQSLQSIDRLVASIDVDELEHAGIAQPTTTTSTSLKRPAPADSKPIKAKKPRKSRLPKDYDPNKQPDPERWLPLRDRSTYRPKGKKGKARREALSQGAVMAQGSGNEDSRPATPGAEVLKGKSVGGGGGGKKKKGKR
ncbi:Signal recognition particle subunit SRP72 [Recurvomyces mirabilis]|uniref:Signal recognition particle subunit SRP72 n=1 Tax=Recurvomyces mirabilis TaxID=574656 RepID=UPI002DE05D00|nr:Signal recognition particle subunit SRP72 [Recurvomyces mirabilis]